MKKITYLLPILVILIAGCAQQNGNEVIDQEQSESGSDIETKWIVTIDVEINEDIGPNYAYQYQTKQIESGTYTFKLSDEIGYYTTQAFGTGSLKSIFTATGECNGKGSTTIDDYVVVAELAPDSGKMTVWAQRPGLDRSSVDYTLACSNNRFGSDTSEQSFDIYFHGDKGRMSFDPVSGDTYERTFSSGISIPTSEKVKATLYKASELPFDFDVDVDPPIVTIKQGGTAQVAVTVKLLRGEPQPVKLTVTDWSTADISSWFADPQITPKTQGALTTFFIKTTCNTKPDAYLHTVQGETEGTFRTSVDSVNVNVTRAC